MPGDRGYFFNDQERFLINRLNIGRMVYVTGDRVGVLRDLARRGYCKIEHDDGSMAAAWPTPLGLRADARAAAPPPPVRGPDGPQSIA